MATRKFRQIHTKMWKDGWFVELAPSDKLLFVYLITNDSAAIAGIYELARRVIEFETGLSAEQIVGSFEIFSEAGRAFYDGRVVFVRHLRRYHETRSDRVQKRIRADYEAVPECEIKRLYTDVYGMDTLSDETKVGDDGYPMDRVSTRLSTSTSRSVSSYRSDLMAPLGEGELDRMVAALAVVCEIDPDIEDNRRRLVRTAAQLAPKYDARFVLDRYEPVPDGEPPSEWYINDWRGQKGQAPTLALVSQTIAMSSFGKPDPKREKTEAEREAQYDELGVQR